MKENSYLYTEKQVEEAVKSRWQSLIAASAFIALFPGFFLYHTVLGFGIIPPVLGGFFGPVAVAVFPLILLIFFWNIGRYKKNWSRIEVAFLALMGYSTIIALVNFADGRSAFGNTEMLTWSISGVLFNLVAYLLARTIPIESKGFRKIIYFSLIGMFLIALLNVGESGIFYIKEQSANEDAVATYQGFARSIAVVAMLTISMVRRKLLFLFSAFLGVVALFLSGARTELVCFIISAAIILLTRFNFMKSALASALLIALAFVIVGLLSASSYEKFVANNRNLELLDLSNSTSAEARLELGGDALRTIAENPIFGDYASYLSSGGVGSYAHNLLSAWVNLGVVGFFLYVAIFFGVLTRLFGTRNRLKSENVSWGVATAVFAFTFVAMLFGKEYTFMLFGLMIGFYGRAFSIIRAKR